MTTAQTSAEFTKSSRGLLVGSSRQKGAGQTTTQPQPWSGLHAARGHAGVLQREDFATLRQFGSVQHVPVGTVVASAGSGVRHVQVVVSGELQLCARIDGRRVPALLVRSGGVISDIPLLLDAPMPYDAVATQDAEILRLTRDRWMRMLSSNQSLCLRWMQSMARRLDDDRRRLLVVTTRPLPAQVAYLLLEMAEPGDDGQPEVRLSQETIAHLLGARRQSVTRVLSRLRKEGCITSRYGATLILDEEGLRAAQGDAPLPTGSDIHA
jgi:CRP-like cAMP-binding protein